MNNEAHELMTKTLSDALPALGAIAVILSEVGSAGLATICVGLRMEVAEIVQANTAPGTPEHVAATSIVSEATDSLWPAQDVEQPANA
jgi:hypothetical protein